VQLPKTLKAPNLELLQAEDMSSSSISREEEHRKLIQASLKVTPTRYLLGFRLTDVYDCLNAYMLPSAA